MLNSKAFGNMSMISVIRIQMKAIILFTKCFLHEVTPVVQP